MIWKYNNNYNNNQKNLESKIRKKNNYGYFKWQTKEIAWKMMWTWIRRGNLKKKMKSLIAIWNNVIRTNYVKEKINNMQKNSKHRLCSNNKMVNCIISECRKLALKEYKKRLNKVGKFDHANKWYMRKQEYLLKNKTHRILCDLKIQIDDLSLTRKPDLVLITNEKEFVIPADHRRKMKR